MGTHIAVVIPCYNAGRFVHEALESVLAQTRRAAEIAIVDDGSTDVFTREQLERLRGLTTAIIRTPNGGVSAARNTGLRQTSSPYVVTLDADDRLDSRYLEATSAVLDSDPDIGFVSTAIQAFGEASYCWSPSAVSAKTALTRGAAHPASMFRRELWQTVGGFDELPAIQGCEDLDFWISAIAAGFKGVVLPDPLLLYRVRRQSVHQRKVATGQQLQLLEAVLKKHRPLVDAVGPDLLLEKETLLQEQREYRAGLQRRAASLHGELNAIETQIHDKVDALARRGRRSIDWGDLARSAPFGAREGEDRGTPIDIHYVNLFLQQHAPDMRGETGWFGRPAWSLVGRRSGAGNTSAGSVGSADLSDLASMHDESLDCLVVTGSLGSAPQALAALTDARRVLRPGGVLLCALSIRTWMTDAAAHASENHYGWTEASSRRLVAEVFPVGAFSIRAYGDVLGCLASLYALGAEDLPDPRELPSDHWHPLLFGIRAVKSQ